MNAAAGLSRSLPGAALLGIAALWFGISAFPPNPASVNLFFRDAVPLGLVAVGLYPVFLSRKIDLSQFAVADLAGTAAALTANACHQPLAALLAALAVGCMVGVVNGAVIGRLRINSFLATYCMSLIIKGILFVATKGRLVDLRDGALLSAGRGDILFVPIPVLLFAAVFAALVYLMRQTMQGRRIRAAGANPIAAAITGIRVPLVTVGAFALSGACAALAGLAAVSMRGSVSTGLNLSVNLSAIVVVVFAGTDLDRPGPPVGLLSGLLLFALMDRGLARLGIPEYCLLAIQGLILLSVILCNAMLDARKRKRSFP